MRGHNVLHLPSSAGEVYANDQRVNYTGHELWPRRVAGNLKFNASQWILSGRGWKFELGIELGMQRNSLLNGLSSQRTREKTPQSPAGETTHHFIGNISPESPCSARPVRRLAARAEKYKRR